MGLYDTVTCELRLPNPQHQDLVFQTKDLDGFLDRYTITGDGRLVRFSRPGGKSTKSNVEMKVDGDVHIYSQDLENAGRYIEYKLRFTHGRVEWVRRVDEQGESVPKKHQVRFIAPVELQKLLPTERGRRLTYQEFATHSPDKLELVDGEIREGENLLLLLLTNIGLRRASLLVGPDRWKKALTEDDPPEP